MFRRLLSIDFLSRVYYFYEFYSEVYRFNESDMLGGDGLFMFYSEESK